MTVIATALFEATDTPTTDTAMYTCPSATRVYIDKLTATNTTAAALTININLVAASGAAGSSNLIVSAYSIAAGASYTFPEVVGHVLNPGAFLNAKASATGITLRASGRVMT